MKSLLAILLCGLATPICLASGSALPAVPGPDFLFMSGQGYLGVNLGEVDRKRAASLHLTDTHGAEVTMIDHDAPAGKSGLKIHDVILQLDGQPFDTAEQLRHRLKELPSGRTVNLLVSRNGDQKNILVQLCDRAALEKQAWQDPASEPARVPTPSRMPASAFISKPRSVGPAFLTNVLTIGPYLGAEVNPVHTQLADYFGVTSGTGLLVLNVEADSPASRAGMKAGDVIVKVDAEPMKSRGEWVKAMRKHRREPVPVTVMRNKQQVVLTVTAGKAKKS